MSVAASGLGTREVQPTVNSAVNTVEAGQIFRVRDPSLLKS